MLYHIKYESPVIGQAKPFIGEKMLQADSDEAALAKFKREWEAYNAKWEGKLWIEKGQAESQVNANESTKRLNVTPD